VTVNEITAMLADALSDCEEYKDFVAAKEKLRKNPSNGELLDLFRQKQFELQMAELAGHEIDEETKARLEEDYQLLCQTPEINEYLNAEYRFSLVMSDIQGAIAAAVPEWFDFSSMAVNPKGVPHLQ